VRCIAEKPGGRLLGEFLVGLGLLFLALTANLAILHSASRASAHATTEEIALDLARNSMERVIADPDSVRNVQVFEVEGTSYHQEVRLTPAGEPTGLTVAVVELTWERGMGERQVRLERYVRSR